jgi:hypothetical protein
MSTEAERLAELVTDLGRRLAQAFGDVLSPEAQRHLRNAQREALTALFLVYEEQMGRRTGRSAPAGGSGDAGDDGDDWPQDMEEAVRWAGADTEVEEDLSAESSTSPPPRMRRPRSRPAETVRPSRVKKIELD